MRLIFANSQIGHQCNEIICTNMSNFCTICICIIYLSIYKELNNVIVNKAKTIVSAFKYLYKYYLYNKFI